MFLILFQSLYNFILKAIYLYNPIVCILECHAVMKYNYIPGFILETTFSSIFFWLFDQNQHLEHPT
jgi:hypothetical protein